MLLSIATVGRDYSVRVPPNFKLSTSQLDQVAENEIRPQLADGDWAGAAIAAANGYREALGGSSARGGGSPAASSWSAAAAT